MYSTSMNKTESKTFEKGYLYGVGPKSGLKKPIGVIESESFKSILIAKGKAEGYKVVVEGNNVTFFPEGGARE
jgi:hypothetical protein